MSIKACSLITRTVELPIASTRLKAVKMR